jgi:hypothetical protein
VCRSCGLGTHPLDEQLGLTGSLSRQAERLVALAGASWSFDRSESILEEFCGVKISDTTIRKYATETGRRVRQWQRESAPIKERFAQAVGDIEFSTDGTFINTLQGWREVRLNIFAKRERGERHAGLCSHRKCGRCSAESGRRNNWGRIGGPGRHAMAFALLRTSPS